MSGETDDYDEFGMLGDNAAEAGLALTAPPRVTRTSFTLAGGQTVSALAWGDAEPELVLLHGGGQNAHTWDTLALALGRPLLAVDLPGHGHSGRRRTATTARGATPRRSPPSSSRPRPPPGRWSACRSAAPPPSGSRPPAPTWCAAR